jgi:hypothetical protein
MQTSTWQQKMSRPINVGVRQIHDEAKIVFLYGGIEQEWAGVPQLEKQM